MIIDVLAIGQPDGKAIRIQPHIHMA